MHLVDDADDCMVDGDEPDGQRFGRLPRGNEVHELTRSRHVGGVGCHDGLSRGPLAPVERLDDEKPDTLETLALDRGDDGSPNGAELHVTHLSRRRAIAPAP